MEAPPAGVQTWTDETQRDLDRLIDGEMCDFIKDTGLERAFERHNECLTTSLLTIDRSRRMKVMRAVYQDLTTLEQAQLLDCVSSEEAIEIHDDDEESRRNSSGSTQSHQALINRSLSDGEDDDADDGDNDGDSVHEEQRACVSNKCLFPPCICCKQKLLDWFQQPVLIFMLLLVALVAG